MQVLLVTQMHTCEFQIDNLSLIIIEMNHTSRKLLMNRSKGMDIGCSTSDCQSRVTKAKGHTLPAGLG